MAKFDPDVWLINPRRHWLALIAKVYLWFPI